MFNSSLILFLSLIDFYRILSVKAQPRNEEESSPIRLGVDVVESNVPVSVFINETDVRLSVTHSLVES